MMDNAANRTQAIYDNDAPTEAELEDVEEQMESLMGSSTTTSDEPANKNGPATVRLSKPALRLGAAVGFLLCALVLLWPQGGSNDATIPAEPPISPNAASPPATEIMTNSTQETPVNTPLPNEENKEDKEGEKEGEKAEEIKVDETDEDKSEEIESDQSNESEEKVQFDENDARFVPHFPFGDHHRHYRRVCAPVHSSILCMTVRFPIDLLLQDPAYDYPHPIDERFYSFDKKSINVIDGQDLQKCRDSQTGETFADHERAVQTCLDDYAATLVEPDTNVVTVWTRHRLLHDATPDFYGVQKNPAVQKARIVRYFDHNPLILGIGASPTPGIMECFSDLFDDCQRGGKNLTDDKIAVGTWQFYPRGGRRHNVNFKDVSGPLSERLAQWGPKDYKPKKPLRKLSLLLEYPLAHCQNINESQENFSVTADIQNRFPQALLEAGSPTGRAHLREVGFELQHIIAFDGRPQFFPTATNQFPFGNRPYVGVVSLTEKGGFGDLLKPEYGSDCVGPIPPTSNFTYINQLSRQSFREHGHDMRWYGQTWEFHNLFWYQVKGLAGSKLDCTHSGGEGMNCIHKYFVMAMVDDHFDNFESGRF